MSNKLTMKNTKILATIGPAVDSQEKIAALIDAGVNGCRMNFSHGNPEERNMQFQWIREYSAKVGKHVAILQDLQGPKIRIGQLKDDMQFDIEAGDEIGLTYGIEHDGGNNQDYSDHFLKKSSSSALRRRFRPSWKLATSCC